MCVRACVCVRVGKLDSRSKPFWQWGVNSPSPLSMRRPLPVEPPPPPPPPPSPRRRKKRRGEGAAAEEEEEEEVAEVVGAEEEAEEEGEEEEGKKERRRGWIKYYVSLGRTQAHASNKESSQAQVKK